MIRDHLIVSTKKWGWMKIEYSFIVVLQASLENTSLFVVTSTSLAVRIHFLVLYMDLYVCNIIIIITSTHASIGNTQQIYLHEPRRGAGGLRLSTILVK